MKTPILKIESELMDQLGNWLEDEITNGRGEWLHHGRPEPLDDELGEEDLDTRCREMFE